jgi:hypothetical protein
MQLEHIFFISQSVAGLAIVVSLVFVGLEVRLSNRESRHRAIEEMLGDYRDVRLQIMANADNAGLWLRGLVEFPTLDPVDRARFVLMAHSIFDNQQSFYLHYRDGRLTAEMYEPQNLHLGDIIAYPGLQAAWDIRKNYFCEVFRTFVDGKIAAAQKQGAAPSLYGERRPTRQPDAAPLSGVP